MPRMEDWPRISEALGLPSDALHKAAFGDAVQTPAEELAELRERLARAEEQIAELLRRQTRRRDGGDG